MKLLGKFEDAATAIILWVLFANVGLQFFTRYVLNNSLGWTEEIARMLLIVLTYAGAVVCARKASHIQVDLLLQALPDTVRKFVSRLFDLTSALLFVFLSWTAVQFALRTRLMMSSIEIPKSIIYWFCAVALLFMALHYFLHFLGVTNKTEQQAKVTNS